VEFAPLVGGVPWSCNSTGLTPCYGVWKFFGTDGVFLHWYINFEAPVVRCPGRLSRPMDHGLDLIVYPDGTRVWKDVDDLHRQREQGA